MAVTSGRADPGAGSGADTGPVAVASGPDAPHPPVEDLVAEEPGEHAPSGRRAAVLRTAALVALCLVVVDTAVGILPGDALASAGVPLLSLLTVERLVVLGGLLCLVVAAPRLSTFLTPLDVVLVLLLLVAGWATLANGRPLASWRGLLTAVAVYYLAVGVLRTHRDAVPVLLATILGSAFVAAAVGVEQYAEAVDTGFCRVGLSNSTCDVDGAVGRSTGTFSNPNLLAGYLVLTLPVTVGLLARPVSGRLRVAWALLGAVGAAGLVVTFSRGPIAAALAVAAAAGVAVLARDEDRRRVLLPAAAVAAGVAALGLVVGLASGVVGRLTGRGELWSAALDAASAGGVDGVGYGRAGDVMTAVAGQEYAHAHNLWLNWLVDVGPLGPILVTLLLGIALVAGWRRAASGSALAGGAVAGLAGLALASIVDHPSTVGSILVMTFVVAACAVAGVPPDPRLRGGHAGPDEDDAGPGGSYGYGSEGYRAGAYGPDGYGSDEYGTDGYGSDGYRTDGYGSDGYGNEAYGPDAYGSDGYGNEGYGSDAYGSDGYQDERYGSDGYGADGDPYGYGAGPDVRGPADDAGGPYGRGPYPDAHPGTGDEPPSVLPRRRARRADDGDRD